MSRENKNSSFKIIITLVLIGVILLLALSLMNYFKMESKSTVNSEMVESYLKDAKELTTLRYHYKNVASFENSQEFQGMTVPFTTKRFIYTYEGDIKAGVDLDRASVTVSNDSDEIRILLPATRILSHEIDENSIMFFDEKESVFNQLKLDDYTVFRAEEKERVESDSIERGILVEARDRTETAIRDILKLIPDLENYNVVIESE